MKDDIVVTVDHQEIVNWAKKHNALPEVIDDPDAGSDDIGIRLDIAGRADDQYLSTDRISKLISWSDFFDKFEEMKLAFVYKVGADDKSGLSYKFIKRGESISSASF
ncbi:hypothetical protein C4577_03285 [Candidatus Parcubacteria bacterium]|nr:MAG: hypothetical protein C4577_03285 [Candidatus Parcubacteria bacterium]